MNVRLCAVHWDSARRGERMGAGPARLLAGGLAERLRDDGHRVSVAEIDPPEGARPAEIRTAFDLARALAAQVAEARAAGAFPIVLAGNCFSALGTVAGLGAGAAGVLWLDAHGDFNTPETTTGGFLDGMALAALTGRCWTRLAAGIPGFAPVPEADAALAGARDLDPPEAELLARSALARPSRGALVAEVAEWARGLARRGRRLYAHVDLDVLDPASVGRVNEFAAPGGLALDELLAVVGEAAAHCPLAGAALTAYDPAYDGDGRVRDAGIRVARALAALAAR
jgi:arginase